MKAFRYERPRTLEALSKALADGDGGGATLKANGIDLLDRMKERVDEPSRVVTLIDVPGLDKIERLADGTLRIGAMATLSAIAASNDVGAACGALARAADGAASPQLRNRATLGGNLAQHTRCGYYRIKSFPCFKRGGEPCPVLAPGAVQETAGIFGIGECACAHPSSLAPVLGALDATVVVLGAKGERRLTISGLYEAPRQGKASDTTLASEDVITAVEISSRGPESPDQRTSFLEIRQRAAFDWALVSCAARVLCKDRVVKEARVWLGAVAPMPWRSEAAEKALIGKPFSEAIAIAAGEEAAKGATPLAGNSYKVDLVKVAVKRALLLAGGC